MKIIFLMSLCVVHSFIISGQKPDVNRKIDTVFLNLLEDIKREVETEKVIKDEKKRLQENKLDLEKKISNLEIKIDELKSEGYKQSIKINKGEEYKKEQILVLEKEIAAVIINGTELPSELLGYYSERGFELKPKNFGELSEFKKFRDTIIAIKSFFEREYDASLYQTVFKRFEILEEKLKLKSASFPKLNREAEALRTSLVKYCSNTEHIYKRFQKIYLLRNDLSSTDAFSEELKKLTFWAKDYPFLYKLIDEFLRFPKKQEEYKDRKFSCN
ncbi:MAG: hypothetical protein FJX80_00565 [Bacteroidetes bacterium]|nr:hypothetical protein [Bacteroidota bacterium]